MSKKILITGANRGLGLGFVKSSLDRGYTVFAGCRIPDKAEELQELENNFKERLFIISLDPTKLDSIQRVAVYTIVCSGAKERAKKRLLPWSPIKRVWLVHGVYITTGTALMGKYVHFLNSPTWL